MTDEQKAEQTRRIIYGQPRSGKSILGALALTYAAIRAKQGVTPEDLASEVALLTAKAASEERH
jgi:hypothetical protein